MEVFLATTKYLEPLGFRQDIALAVYNCWRMLGAKVLWQVDDLSPTFQRTRRIEADDRSNEETYIVADDDCLPVGMDFIPCVLHLARQFPEFGYRYIAGIQVQRGGWTTDMS